MKLHPFKGLATFRLVLAGVLVLAILSGSSEREAQGSTVTGRGVNTPQRLVTLPQPP